MKRMFSIAAALVALCLAACSSYSPDAGHEVVLVEKPWFFGHGGVDPIPVTTGLTFAAFTTDGVDVDVRPTMHQLLMHDIMTSDGVPLSFDATINLQVVDSVSLIRNFGQGWYERNLEQPFGTAIRNAVKQHGMNETAISASAIDSIDKDIHDSLVDVIQNKGLPVKLLSVTVGRANPPDAIKSQRIETAAQEQRVQTEKQIKLAEDQRKDAETARAAADNAYRQALGLTPEQYVQLKNIEMVHSVCSSGKCTFIQGGTATPVVNIK